jgi:hypothetical protein
MTGWLYEKNAILRFNTRQEAVEVNKKQSEFVPGEPYIFLLRSGWLVN